MIASFWAQRRSDLYPVDESELHLHHRNIQAVLAPVGRTWAGAIGRQYVQQYLYYGWNPAQLARLAIEVRQRINSRRGVDHQLETPDDMARIVRTMTRTELTNIRFGRTGSRPTRASTLARSDGSEKLDTKRFAIELTTSVVRADSKLPDPIPGRCNARTRGNPPGRCKRYPAGGRTRCRLHGGASTGARTAEGKARISAAVSAANRRRKGRAYRTFKRFCAEFDAVSHDPVASAEFLLRGPRKLGQTISKDQQSALARMLGELDPKQMNRLLPMLLKVYRGSR